MSEIIQTILEGFLSDAKNLKDFIKKFGISFLFLETMTIIFSKNIHQIITANIFLIIIFAVIFIAGLFYYKN
jgi:predicted Na+-dependent transporter